MESGKNKTSYPTIYSKSKKRNPEDKKEINPTNPFIIAFLTVKEFHNRATLPIIILLLVNLYNYVVFQTVVGKEIYLSLPVLLLIVAYLTSYWKCLREDYNQYRVIAGFVSIILALFWDLIISISYFPSENVRGYDLESLPTLLLDLIGLVSIFIWIKQNLNELKPKIGLKVEIITTEDQSTIVVE